jgi:hypothetical protein
MLHLPPPRLSPFVHSRDDKIFSIPNTALKKNGFFSPDMPTPQAQGLRRSLQWHSDGSESGSSIASTAPSTPRTVIHADPSFVVYTYTVPLPRFEPPPRPGSMAVRKRVSQADAHLRAGVRQAKADACYGQAQALKSSRTYAHVRAPQPLELRRLRFHLQLG